MKKNSDDRLVIDFREFKCITRPNLKKATLFQLHGRFHLISFLVVTVTVVSLGLVGWVGHRYDNVFFPLWAGISTCDSHPVSHTLATITAVARIRNFKQPSTTYEEVVDPISDLFGREAAINVAISTNCLFPAS